MYIGPIYIIHTYVVYMYIYVVISHCEALQILKGSKSKVKETI